MKALKNIYVLLFFAVCSSSSLLAQDKQTEKLQKSAAVLRDFAGMREERIPVELLQKAQGVVIIPNLVKAGLGIGGQRGKGVAIVKKADGSWSDPVFVTLTGGSIGFQAGVQAIDLVMVFTKGSVLSNLAKGEFTLGGDIGVAAGPVGRSSSANTDTRLDAEVYSYSRSKGLFAGLTLNGSKLSPDEDANKSFYPSNSSAEAIFSSPSSGKAEVTALKNSLKSF